MYTIYMFPSTQALLASVLPKFVYKYILRNYNKEGFKKYFKNTGWMLTARATTLITSFLTMAIVARYLGPENLGKLSYAQSFVSILSVFAALGIDQILYRDLSAKPEQEKELLGTVILTKFIFGTVAFIAAVLISVCLGNEMTLTFLIAITALTFLINPIGTIGILFQAKVQAKFSSIITIYLAFLIPALKLTVIFFEKGIIYFSFILVVEALVISLWSLYIYITKFDANPFRWRFSPTIFYSILGRSWPLLLASLSGYMYGRIDQVMLLHYVDATAVGFYDIAVRLTEYAALIPGVVIASLFPAIVSARETNQNEYLKRFKSLTFISFCFTFSAVILIFLLAPFIITTIFGEDFFASIRILQIYIWSTLGTILIVLMQQFFIIEGKSIQFLLYSTLGAIINIGLNSLLIPQHGVHGAAYATLITLVTILGVFIAFNLHLARSVIKSSK